MKKFLSLMLAMIMVMSLVTVGAGAADFTDEADIEQVEAVALLSGLGIISGYDDGSFNPTGSLSRGAAAKIITWMTIGTAKVDAMKDSGVDEVPFPDVRKDSSTAVFIEYCKEQGIIGGYSDGNFRPYDDLSGHAFLKMALIALGVDDIDFTAKGWQVDAVAEAEEMGLLEGIDTDEVNLGLALTRENACQIAYNALGYSATSKTYYPVLFTKTENNVTTTTEYMQCEDQTDAIMYATILGGANAGYTVGDKVTVKKDSLGAKVFNLGEYTGTVSANAATDKVVANAGKTTVGAKTFKFASDASLIGHKVTVYYNTKTDAVYSVLDLTATVKLSKSTKDLGNLAAALDVEVSKLADNKYNGAAITVAKYTDELVAEGTQTITFTQDKTSSDYGKANVSGTALVVYNETTEKYEIIGFVATPKVTLSKVTKIVTDAGKETITLEGITTLANGKVNTTTDKAEDAIVEYDGIAKGDYVAVTKAGNVYTVSKVETVTGKVTKIGSSNALTVGGTTYSKNSNNVSTGLTFASDINFTTEYTLYLDGTGKYFGAVAAKASSETVYVVEAYTTTEKDVYGKESTAYWAQAIDLNGDELIIRTTATTTGGVTVNDAKAWEGKLAKVTVEKKDGVEYAKFAAVTGAKSYDLVDLESTTIRLDDETEKGYYYFNEDVKFISVVPGANLEDLEITVKTGVQKIVDKTITFVATAEKNADGEKTGNYTVAYVFVAGAFAEDFAATDDIVYAIEGDGNVSTKLPYTDADGETAMGYQHTVYIDGVKTTIVTTAAAKLNGFITLKKVVDGVYATEANNAGNLVQSTTITGKFQTKIDLATGLKAIDVADAEIYDLRPAAWLSGMEKDAITEAEDLYVGLNVALVTDKDAKNNTTIAVIYIFGKA